jgi:hypothetical protein
MTSGYRSGAPASTIRGFGRVPGGDRGLACLLGEPAQLHRVPLGLVGVPVPSLGAGLRPLGRGGEAPGLTTRRLVVSPVDGRRRARSRFR